jgi:hypothetical protein
MTNDAEQELVDQYRIVSAEDAGPAPAAVRKAVLAEAAAAARRRQPAANDGKYLWRAVASIGVMAIALLIWRESEPELSRAPAGELRTVKAARDTTNAAPAAQTSAPSAQIEHRSRPSQRQEKKAEAMPPPMPTSPSLSRSVQVAEAGAPSPARPPQDAERVDAVVQDAAAGAVAAGAAEATTSVTAAAPAKAAKQPQSDVAASAGRSTQRLTPAQLYQLHFPDSNDANTETSIAWLLMNNAGEVLEKGRLLPSDSLETLRIRLIDRHRVAISAWQSMAGYDQQGRPLRIAIARTNQ